jgi:hypothetical protein
MKAAGLQLGNRANRRAIALCACVGQEYIGFNGKPLAVAYGPEVIVTERFLDFAFAENGTPLGSDSLAEVAVV